MQNIKKYKIIYVVVFASIILICIIICFIMDNNKSENYDIIEIEEENTNNTLESSEENAKNTLDNSERNNTIYIHIAGEVVNPGIVILNEGDRVKDAIDKAGGLTYDADTEKINLAYQLCDGQKINIPNINNKSKNEENYITENNGENIIIANKNNKKNNNKININTATQSELETLTGIGPSTAAKIIEYRNTKGKFKKIEDIKNVSGIGKAKYDNIKNDIIC